jgi:hypothetical protein
VRSAMMLQQIDELTRSQHFFLADDDRCFFLREYTAGVGYEHGETNNLISNLKKKVDRRGRPEWVYKERAIQQAGQELRQVLLEDLRNHRDRLTIVPMPPSRIKTNPLYDDRMRRIVDVMTQGLGSDVRELVLQAKDMPAAHEAAGAGRSRPRPEDWYAVYYVDESVAAPTPQNIVVMDDVLTAGAHFVGIKRRLRERFPSVGEIVGCFYARRAVQAPDDE